MCPRVHITYPQQNDWYCTHCCESLYLLNHLSDDILFELCAIVHGLPDNVNIGKSACLNSNQFTLAKRNIVTINDYDVDPDTNFYDCLASVQNK